MLDQINVAIGTLRFQKEHSVRGIGMYTRLLTANLKKLSFIHIIENKNQLIKPNIIHYPSFDFFFSSLPFSLSTPAVVTIHDVIPLIYPDKYPRGIKGAVRLKRQKLALKTMRAVITDSETSKTDIHKHLKVPLKKIYVVPLAANPEIQAQPPAVQKKVLQELDIPPLYVLYVGDIGYNKNIPQLIKMMKFLPLEIHLVCVGKNFKPQPIPEWNQIEAQLAMSDVSTRVHFINSIHIDANLELGALYSGSLCYIQPSLYEGFGLPLLEAMQAKTIVVSSNTSALMEIGGKATLFTDPTAESFAEQVKLILSWTKKKRAEYIEQGYKWSQKFSWKKAASQTASVYKEVLQ